MTAFVKDNHEVVTPDFHSDVAFGYNTGHGGTASDNTINAALGRLGYSTEDQTDHGFRTMASTSLNEQGFPPAFKAASKQSGLD